MAKDGGVEEGKIADAAIEHDTSTRAAARRRHLLIRLNLHRSPTGHL